MILLVVARLRGRRNIWVNINPNPFFCEQSPQGWLRVAQHAILGAKHFARQA